VFGNKVLLAPTKGGGLRIEQREQALVDQVLEEASIDQLQLK
jgi:hypothetical protein